MLFVALKRKYLPKERFPSGIILSVTRMGG
jgi:hypothetical protein